MNNRVAKTFLVLGAFLLLLAAFLPGIPLLLHHTGIIEGWSGFGLFFLGSILLPWILGFGLLLTLIAIILRRMNWKSRSGRVALSVVVASMVFLGYMFASRLPRMFPTESSHLPPELKEGVVAGATKFAKELFYSGPELGVISDIDQGQAGQITIAGRRGGALIGPDRAPVKTLNFEQCLSDVALVKVGTRNFWFLCRGDYTKNQDTKMFDADGKTLWSYGGNPGVVDAAGGALGNGVTGVVVCLYGKHGGPQLLDLLDPAGKPIWQREDSDVTHLEIAAFGDPGAPAILSNPGGITIRNGNGNVLAHFDYPRMYLGNFSLTAWGTDRNRDKLVTSHQDGIYVLGTDGTIIARLQAAMPQYEDAWTTYGTPMLTSTSARYYATLQRYDKWNRSVLRVYDDQNRPVYEEVLAGNCAALRTLSNKNGLEDLLLGCDGKLLRYSLRDNGPG